MVHFAIFLFEFVKVYTVYTLVLCDGPQNTQIAIQVKWFHVPNAKIWIFTESNAFEESMKSRFS